MIFQICFALLMVLWIVVYHLHLLNLPEPVIYLYITLLLIAVIQPTVIFTTILRNYYSSNHLRNTLDMDLAEDNIKNQRRILLYVNSLVKNYKIVEKKTWFLIYQNNISAILIPKKSIARADFISMLKLSIITLMMK